MPADPFIFFNGNCREAVEYYAEVFETDSPEIETFEENLEDIEIDLSEADTRRVMYTSLEIEGSVVMFSDAIEDDPVTFGTNMSLVITSDSIDKIRKYFQRLEEDGQVLMPLKETFWSKCFGAVIDKFGILWQFNLEGPGIDEIIKKRKENFNIDDSLSEKEIMDLLDEE